MQKLHVKLYMYIVFLILMQPILCHANDLHRELRNFSFHAILRNVIHHPKLCIENNKLMHFDRMSTILHDTDAKETKSIERNS